MRQHPLDGQMRLAGIGGAQNGRDVALACHGVDLERQDFPRNRFETRLGVTSWQAPDHAMDLVISFCSCWA